MKREAVMPEMTIEWLQTPPVQPGEVADDDLNPYEINEYPLEPGELEDMIQFSEDIAAGRIDLTGPEAAWPPSKYEPDPNEPTVMDILILVDDIADFRQFAADVAAGRIDLSKYPRARDLPHDERDPDEPGAMDALRDEADDGNR